MFALDSHSTQQQAKKHKLQVIQVGPPSFTMHDQKQGHVIPKTTSSSKLESTPASFMASPPPEKEDICIQLPPIQSILKGSHVNNYRELTLPPLLCNVQHQ